MKRQMIVKIGIAGRGKDADTVLDLFRIQDRIKETPYIEFILEFNRSAYHTAYYAGFIYARLMDDYFRTRKQEFTKGIAFHSIEVYADELYKNTVEKYESSQNRHNHII